MERFFGVHGASMRLSDGVLARNLDPLLLSMTLQDRFAQDNFTVPVREGGKRGWGIEIASVDEFVKGAETLLHGIRVTFVMPAGITGGCASGIDDQCWISNE
jgi:hypothetical protein